MKIDAQKFAQLVRKIVREEVRRVLPEVLSEQYIKKVVSESRGNFVQEEEEDDLVPEPVENDHRGVYDDPAMFAGPKKATTEVASKLLSARTNPLSFIYEGIQPHNEAAPAAGSVNVEKMEQAFNLDFSRMADIVRKSEKKNSGHSSLTEEDVLKRLEEKRRQLDVPVPAAK